MTRYENTVLNQVGRPVSGATISIFLTGTVTPATIYSDDGVTPKANPFTTDSLGRFSFFVADGKYTIEVSGTGITTYTLADIEIADVSERHSADADWKVGTATINTVNFDNTSSDVTLARVAANILATGSGDSFASDTLLLDRTNRDVSLTRSAANSLLLGTGDKFLTENINNIRYANQFAGADLGAKIDAAIADIPAGGGTVDARGLEGAQSISSAVAVSKPVTILLGATAISATGTAFAITSDNAAVIGLGDKTAITQATAGADTITATTVSGVRIQNLKIVGEGTNAAEDGIHLTTCTGCEVSGVTVDGTSGPGIFVDGGSRNRIVGNTLLNQTDGATFSGVGVVVKASARNLITHNTIRDTAWVGISVERAGSDENIVSNNTILDVLHTPINLFQSVTKTLVIGNYCEADGGSGIVDDGDTGTNSLNAIIGNHIISPAVHGVMANFAQKSLISGNYINTPAQHGVHLQNTSTDATVQDNFIDTPTQHGVSVADGSIDRPTIKGNTVLSAGSRGISLTAASGSIDAAKVSNNIIRSSTGIGIFAQRADDAQITDNLIVSPTGDGIRSETGSRLTITGNVVRNSGDEGLFVDFGATHTIGGNQISGSVTADYTINDSATFTAPQFTSNVATGTAPLVVSSTTKVTNLNADQLDGADWASPAAIGTGTPAAATFTTLNLGGATVTDILSATAALDFDLSAAATHDLTVTVTGAADGDTVAIGVPNGSVTADTLFWGWVSAADTVTVRAMRIAGTPNPASGTFRVTVIKF